MVGWVPLRKTLHDHYTYSIEHSGTFLKGNQTVRKVEFSHLLSTIASNIPMKTPGTR